MNTLPDLLGFVTALSQNDKSVRNVHVLETMQFSEDRFTLKVRAELYSGDVLQVRLYQNGQHTDYAHQAFRGESHVMRWDNKEHFSNISSFPHHFHNASKDAEISPLIGNPTHDLPIVLNYIASRPT